MPRVVIKRTDEKLVNAAESCPVDCFKKAGNEYVIDQSQCIDCGVCQTIVDTGVIVEDSEASKEDIEYNEKKANE